MLYGGGGVADMFTVYGIRLCGPSCSSRVRGNFLQMVLTKTGCNDWVGSYVIYSEGARKRNFIKIKGVTGVLGVKGGM